MVAIYLDNHTKH